MCARRWVSLGKGSELFVDHTERKKGKKGLRTIFPTKQIVLTPYLHCEGADSESQVKLADVQSLDLFLDRRIIDADADYAVVQDCILDHAMDFRKDP